MLVEDVQFLILDPHELTTEDFSGVFPRSAVLSEDSFSEKGKEASSPIAQAPI
jgi:hypothetical protein